uniref:Uncharacterized protein n=1 Tax=viral metagenome TaxID=1070528 RepID=A0A6C0IYD5_9ZZZZ
MNLKEDWKYFILVFFITIILGYYLGITISTVVDYRIKEAVITMPKPKNNINILVDDNPKNVTIKSNTKQIESFLNFKNISKDKNINKYSEKYNKIEKKNTKKKVKFEPYNYEDSNYLNL